MTECPCGSYAINDDPKRELCDKCVRDAEIARLTTALAEANAELLRAARDSGAAWQRACERESALAKAQAVVEKLPKTADGVPVVPGMEVWFREPDHDSWIAEFTQHTADFSPPDLVWCSPQWCEFYSTREAAEAVRGGEERG